MFHLELFVILLFTTLRGGFVKASFSLTMFFFSMLILSVISLWVVPVLLRFCWTSKLLSPRSSGLGFGGFFLGWGALVGLSERSRPFMSVVLSVLASVLLRVKGSIFRLELNRGVLCQETSGV